MELKILSVNCQGLGSVEKRLDVFNYLKSKQCDIFCLQDIHSTPSTQSFIESQWGAKCLFSSYSSNSRGVAVLFNKNMDFQVHNHISDPGGNYIIVDLTVDNNKFTLVSLYGPNSDSPAFFDSLFLQAHSFNNTSVVFCGDFNTVQEPKLIYFNYKYINNAKAKEKSEELQYQYNLIDPFRDQNPDTKRYTWRRKNPLKQARLDYFLVSETLLSSVNKCTIAPSYRSDHSMVILNITFTPFKKGKPLWKHNNSLLKDLSYLTVINEKN